MRKRNPTKDNDHGQVGEVGKAKQTQRKYSPRSTSTRAQLHRLVTMLRLCSRHTHELRKVGISHPAGRVKDLEHQGYVIASDRITTVDSDGFSHAGVALYSLISEPEEVSHD